MGMGAQFIYRAIAVLLLAITAAACNQDKVDTGPAFNAAYIAGQADIGNLGPLNQLQSACVEEGARDGKRGPVCSVLDEVRNIRKPVVAPRL
jgi:hypothetical protein